MSNSYRITASTGIHKGDREYQQDQVSLIPHPREAGCLLGVVADGMGGRSGGRKAADQVMMTARQLFERYSSQADDPTALLRQLVNEAHIVIKLTAISSEMEPHSTCAAFLVNPNGECYWIHSGDSRMYHYQGSRMAKRTLDHSYVQTLVDKGEITAEEANTHPQSNILMGCLGVDEDPPYAEHFINQLKTGDTILACSDGVWHYFSDNELGAVLSQLGPREATETLITKARSRARGTGDNLSIALIKIEELVEEVKKPVIKIDLAALRAEAQATLKK
jgi:serine/threonine protein phosphatase PrpC